MSYWNSHPEDWAEVCCIGIAQQLISETPVDILGEPALEPRIEAGLVDTLLLLSQEPDFKPVYDALQDWAHASIMQAEQDYFADTTDQPDYGLR